VVDAPETSTIDRLFLELSQFSKAKTRVQLELEARIADREKLLSGILGGTSQALVDVAIERTRQMRVEGFSREHDDVQHSYRDLAKAASCYAAHAGMGDEGRALLAGAPLDWPWDFSWWKPTTPRRDLIKAAALLLAEIERIDGHASSSAAKGCAE